MSEQTEHQTTVAVEGHVASCTCGWTQKWIRADGSAHEAASVHRASHEKERSTKMIDHDCMNREFYQKEDKELFDQASIALLSMKLYARRGEMLSRVDMAETYPEIRREMQARHGKLSWKGHADTVILEEITDSDGIVVYVLTSMQPERQNMVFMTDNPDVAWMHYDNAIQNCRRHYGIEVKA